MVVIKFITIFFIYLAKRGQDVQLLQDYLITLRNSNLFKDILEVDNIRNSEKMLDLLKLIAFQIGNEV